MSGMLDAATLDAIREQLTVLAHGGRYMNAGTLGPLPRVALDAMAAEQEWDASQRQSPDLWERIVESCAQARSALAALVGVEAEQLALMHSTHEGVNAALWGIDWASGDSIVTTNEEHSAAAMALRHIRDRAGVELRVVEWDDEGNVLAERIAAACTSRTKAVFLSHVSWMSGAIAPLRAIRDAVPAHVRIVVDGAQGAGIVPVSCADDGWDAYTISGQKWPCGPNGTGGLALRDPAAWLPTFGAATHVELPSAPFASPLVTNACRLETSQTAMVPLVGIAAAARWVANEIGVARAHEHARALNTYTRERIAGALGHAPIIHVHGDAHLLAIEFDMPSTAPLVSALWAAGIQCSVPIALRRLRLSLGPWVTTDDIDATIAVLAAAFD